MKLDSSRHQRASEVFLVALRAEPPHRAAVLREHCGEDAELRREVESLLTHHDTTQGVIDTPVLGEDFHLDQIRGAAAAGAPHPQMVGRYRILSRLGEGGMGMVYLAEQDRTRRRVALKVLRPGLLSRHAMRRFEHEHQVLARLQHPGIAHLFEASADENDQPFFAMEYVQGRTLLEHVRQTQPSLSQKLELFAQVCDAVQHAHERGVIHRDLKPSNVIVTEAGQPKILDFGVARVVLEDSPMATRCTDTGQLIGTLAYMSPEQLGAPGSGPERLVDVRCDIYALGVILYELLGDRLPYDVRGKNVIETMRIIGQDDPTPLSSIVPALRGDLATIVGKATEREPGRRYVTAAALAEDVRRHLKDEPILARAPSTAEQLSRFARRHRALAASLAALMIVLIAATAISASYAIRADRALAGESRQKREALDKGRLAADKAQEAFAAQQLAERERLAADEKTRHAQEITAFMVQMLGLADPDVTQMPNMTMQEMLQHASLHVAESFRDQPQAEAMVRTVIGRAYATLGELDTAREHLGRAASIRTHILDAPPEEAYETLWPFYHVLVDLADIVFGPSTQLEAIGRGIIRQREASVAEAITAMNRALGAQAVPESAAEAVEPVLAAARERLASDDPLWIYLADQFYLRARRLDDQGRPEAGLELVAAALSIYREQLPEAHTRIIRATDLEATLLLNGGRFVEAEEAYRRVLSLLSKMLPEDHWSLAACRVQLGRSLIGQDRIGEAREMIEIAQARLAEAIGPSNRFALSALRGLLAVEMKVGDAQTREAARLALGSALAGGVTGIPLASAREVMGPEHEELFAALARLEKALNRVSDDADPAVTLVIETRARLCRPGDIHSAIVGNLLAQWINYYLNRGGSSLEVARRMMVEAMAIEAEGATMHPRIAASGYWWMASTLESSLEFAKAEPYARKASAMLHGYEKEHFGFAANADSVLGGCLHGLGRTAEAMPLLQFGYHDQLESLGSEDLNTVRALDRLLRALVAVGDSAGASDVAMKHLQHIRSRDRSADELQTAAWTVIRVSGLSQATYALTLEMIDRSIERETLTPGRQLMRGAALHRMGRFEEALAELQAARADRPNPSASSRAFTSMSLARLGRLDEAQQEFDMLLARREGISPTTRQRLENHINDALQELNAAQRAAGAAPQGTPAS